MSRTNVCRLATIWIAVLFPSMAIAQAPGLGGGGSAEGTVSGTGIVKLERVPTLLRLTVQLSEKAETLKEALAQMKDRREAAMLQLEELGAAKDSIKIEPPKLVSSDSSQQRQMMRMMQMQRMQGRRVPKGLETPTVSNITALVTAEWEIDAQDHDAMLMFVKDLQDKVAEADLAGLNEPKELSPEAAEMAEEMEAMMSEMGYGEEQVKPGEPRFFFVARLSEVERQETLTKAFQRAKEQAAQLANAAGTELGTLSSLSGMAGQADESMGAYYNNMMYQMRGMMSQMAGQANADSQQLESIAPDPSMCSFQVVVEARFKLK